MIEGSGRGEHDAAFQLLLLGLRGWAQVAQLHAVLLIEVTEALKRAVDVDGVVMAPAAKFRDHALRLAQRIGADEDAALGIFVEAQKQAVDLAHRLGVAEDRKAERRLGDEDVAGHRLKGGAGRVRAALVVA